MKQRIVFPTDEHHGLLARRGAHFGRAAFYTVVEIESDGTIHDVAVVENGGHESGGCGSAVNAICELGADALVVSGIGASPLKGFMNRGLKVFRDTVSGNVHASLHALLADRLHLMQPSQSCSHQH